MIVAPNRPSGLRQLMRLAAAVAVTLAAEIRVYSDMLRPLERESPAVFAENERVLHEVYCSERPGKWDNTVFPYQPHVLNCFQEAMEKGKRGIVLMKAGQIGGSDVMITGGLWLKKHYPGPQLFLTSTEDVASEFGRERFELIIRDMPSLMKRYRPNVRGDIQTKRFVDGKIRLSGGKSVYKLQSTPYRFVGIDELDSLVENLAGEGDPLKLAEVRMDSYTGATLMYAYAHPTTRERGAAKLFFESSDQRRGFVKHDCGAEFWLQWEHVKAVGDERDPGNWHYICPQCAAVIEDAQRAAMVRKMVYRSVLPPEEAARKTWIGLHASQLYSPAKTIRSLAERWIECRDDNTKRVFYNKVLGEPFETQVKEVDLSALRRLIVVQRRAKDPDFYSRGQVPAGVRFLTAGQDSRSTQLHYSVWGWGLRRGLDKIPWLCGWLIEYGCITRPYSLTFQEGEYHVFDDLIYRRVFPSTMGDRVFHVLQCGHDIQYPPTQIPIVRYTRNFRGRAIPVRGASETPTSASRSPYARWGAAVRSKTPGRDAEEVADAATKALILNTYMLKTDWFGWIDKRIEVADDLGGSRKVPILSLPEDVGDEYLEEVQNEVLGNGKKPGELVWKKKGPNHYADTNTYAYGCALNLDPFQKNLTSEEYRARQSKRTTRDDNDDDEADERGGPGEDPAMG